MDVNNKNTCQCKSKVTWSGRLVSCMFVTSVAQAVICLLVASSRLNLNCRFSHVLLMVWESRYKYRLIVSSIVEFQSFNVQIIYLIPFGTAELHYFTKKRKHSFHILKTALKTGRKQYFEHVKRMFPLFRAIVKYIEISNYMIFHCIMLNWLYYIPWYFTCLFINILPLQWYLGWPLWS